MEYLLIGLLFIIVVLFMKALRQADAADEQLAPPYTAGPLYGLPDVRTQAHNDFDDTQRGWD